ncbi:MAG: hypothetical protein M3069_04790 [Chloroflexota bacterium]|nr:hypothetical protein [Chloroflexota bacterium]
MIEKNVWFMSTVGRGIDVDIPSDEPSHIHIPRPSRLRRHNPGPRVEPTDELRDLAAADVMVQAA